jgi:DNA-binding FrmR family transcriptional regulator
MATDNNRPCTDVLQQLAITTVATTTGKLCHMTHCQCHWHTAAS